MELVSRELVGNGLNVLPIVMLQNSVGEPLTVPACQPCHMTSPLEHRLVVNSVPVLKIVKMLQMFYPRVGPCHVFLYPFTLSAKQMEHLL